MISKSHTGTTRVYAGVDPPAFLSNPYVMEKLTTVDLVLLCPILMEMGKDNSPLGSLFKDLYNKMRAELAARPMEAFTNALRTLHTIEPRTESQTATDFIKVMEHAAKLGIKFPGVKL
jgi:hypothetical protein